MTTATSRRVEPEDSPAPADRRHLLIGALLPPVLLLVGWLALLPGARWLVNPDGVVYASLASDVAGGRIADVVTGYWSPLLPVLASPLVAFGVTPLTALRLVLLLSALVALPVLHSLCRAAGAGPVAAGTATVLAVPLLLSASLFGFYPELLLAALLLLHLRAMTVSPGPRGAVVAGIWGALAFLAKAVGLPFVLAFVALVTVVRLLRPGAARAQVLRRAGLTLGITLLLSAPWIVAISVQAGHPTLSTAGAFNAELVTPGAFGNPLNFTGLYAPVPGAVTPWQDPTEIPVQRTERYEGTPVTTNDRLANAVDQATVGAGVVVRRWLPVVALALVGLVVGLRRRRPGAAVAWAGIGAALVLTGGLSLLILIERYLWFPMLAVLPAAALGLAALGGRRRVLAVGAVVLALVAVAQAPVVLDRRGEDRAVWQFAGARCGTPLSGPLAGGGDWERSQLMAYLCGVDYVGLTGPDPTSTANQAALRRVGARHLVVWDRSQGPAGIADGGSGRLYDVAPDGSVPALGR